MAALRSITSATATAATGAADGGPRADGGTAGEGPEPPTPPVLLSPPDEAGVDAGADVHAAVYYSFHGKMGGHCNGAHARPSPTMRDRKGFMEIEMTHIRTDARRTGNPHLRIHVRPVHVHLPTLSMHDGTDVLNRFLEHPMR